MERLRPTTWPEGIDEAILKQKKISSHITVHAEYRRETYRREGATLINGIYRDTGCIVMVHWEQTKIKHFDVYAGAGSKKAVAILNTWIAQGSQKSKDSSAWAKTPAFNHAQWYQEQLEQMEDESLEYFLGPTPEVQEGAPVRPKIEINWPEDLLKQDVTPRVAFGNALQALDDIRKRDKVFITLLTNHRIEILGFDIINVEAAERHYKTMVQRLCTEKSGFQRATNMILDEQEGIDVVLLRAEGWWPNFSDTVVPRLLPSLETKMDQPGVFREEGLHDTQLVHIRDSIKYALEAVSYKKGSYDFVVRLCCVALSSKQMGEEHVGKRHGKDKFAKSIKDKVDLVTKKWLLDNVLGTHLYHRLVACDSFLEPMKSAGYWGTMPVSLEKARPSLRGSWIFRDPNSTQKQPLPPARNVGRPAPMQQAPTETVNTPASLIIIQIDWTDDGEGSYDKTETSFYRLEPGKFGAKVNIELNLLELGESRAWSFALDSMTAMSRSTVPPVLTGFAQRTVLRSGYDVTSTQSFVELDKSPSIKQLMLNERLEKTYSFGVQDTCYKVELTAMWYPGQSLPCWGLAVRHTEWATHLAELERLQTGHQAYWGDTVAAFLPDDGASSTMLGEDDDLGVSRLKLDEDAEKLPRAASREGMRTLTNILLQISGIVSSVTMGQENVEF